MANTILHKRSSTPSAVPLTGDLVVGQLGINTADAKLFIKNSSGDIIDLTATVLSIDIGEYTVATLPPASNHSGAYALATDAAGGRTIVHSDGTFWRIVALEGATVSASTVDANTKLLIHSNASNGNTIFTDSSPSALTVTPSGNAQHSSSYAKFGISSAHFDGNGDYLTLVGQSCTSLGILNDHTIDFWCYLTAYDDGVLVAQQNRYSAIYSSFFLNIAATGYISYKIYNADAVTATSSIVAPLNQWFHVAAVRSGTSMKLYLDGVERGSATTTYPMQDDYGHQVRIGAANYQSAGTIYTGLDGYLSGYLDEIRISDTARWTAPFTPPTSTY